MPLDRIPGPCCIAFAGHWDGRPGRWHWSWLRGQRVSAVEEKIGVVKTTGRTTDLTQTVESLQIEHRGVEHASRGGEVAMTVPEAVRRPDQVFRIHDG
jgi:hypothetical protein